MPKHPKNGKQNEENAKQRKIIMIAKNLFKEIEAKKEEIKKTRKKGVKWKQN